MAHQSDEDDGPDWGFMDGDKFVKVPKLPMLRAGMKAPCSVTLSTGEIRLIILRPDFTTVVNGASESGDSGNSQA